MTIQFKEESEEEPTITINNQLTTTRQTETVEDDGTRVVVTITTDVNGNTVQKTQRFPPPVAAAAAAAMPTVAAAPTISSTPPVKTAAAPSPSVSPAPPVSTASTKRPSRHKQQANQQQEMLIGVTCPAYGVPAPCHPEPVRSAVEGEVSWAWFPEFSWLRTTLGCVSCCLVVSFLMMTSGFSLQNAGLAVTGLIFTLIFCVLLFVIINWKWNADKQFAYKQARGKRLEALKLWSEVDELMLFQAKDTYFETNYGGKTLRVLRDGTIEVHGSHTDGDDEEGAVEDAEEAAELIGGGGEE